MLKLLAIPMLLTTSVAFAEPNDPGQHHPAVIGTVGITIDMGSYDAIHKCGAPHRRCDFDDLMVQKQDAAGKFEDVGRLDGSGEYHVHHFSPNKNKNLNKGDTVRIKWFDNRCFKFKEQTFTLPTDDSKYDDDIYTHKMDAAKVCEWTPPVINPTER